MNPIVMHFGAGALGLGLIVPSFEATDFDIYVCNRRSSATLDRNNALKGNKSYNIADEICLLKKTIEPKKVSITDFIYFDEIEELKSIISTQAPVFLTTALKEYGLKETLKFICELLDYRIAFGISHPLYFIACENAITSNEVRNLVIDHFKKIEREIDLTNIIFIDCVVDRICTTPYISENNDLIVPAEQYGAIILGMSSFKGNSSKITVFFNHLKKAKYIKITEDINFFIRRKKWLVNSAHQIIALYAHATGFFLINEFLKEEEGKKVLIGVMIEISSIYMLNEPDFDIIELGDYTAQIVKRLKSFPSTVHTALSRFTDSKDLGSFLKDFHRKVGEPALNYMSKTEKPLFYISFILLKVSELVEKDNFVKKIP